MTARRPEYLKVIAGTARRDRAIAPNPNALPLVAEAPKPPAWMRNAAAKAEWRRLAPQLIALKVLSEGNVGAFAQFCALHGRLVQCWTAGTTPSAAHINAYRALGADLGLTHIATPAAPAGKPNRFAQIAKRSRDKR